ncbi:hypothetical protein HDU83_007183 [Entophlyctis luteolus]|nr:hypothetical protein HDU82_001782 [Entophlyctis luteolus]KAJ3340238.1 hypothetical protein HDU83_007183 [Entophlyctis luteolus]KAJ3378693.1 hypothetical protein HDU84_007350 [Entophlyctis sp. JEL0112]
MAAPLPLSAFQGIFSNPAFGSLALYEAGNVLLFELVSVSPEDPVLEGVIGRISELQFGVFEVALLGYKNYADPIMTLAFVVSTGEGIDDSMGRIGLGVASSAFPNVAGFDIEMEGELVRFVRVK